MTLRAPHLSSRRAFVAQTSLAAAGIALRPLRALAWTPSLQRKTAAALLPDPIAPESLRTLALAAMDAARQAGATFADIRIGNQHRLEFLWDNSQLPLVSVESEVGYGIRALAGGAWGFIHGNVLTPDAIVSATRRAVSEAKGYAAINARMGRGGVELAAAPAVTGEWATPVDVPPLSVPLDEYARTLLALQRTMGRHITLSGLTQCLTDVVTRVFASTDGSLVSQRLTRLSPNISIVFDFSRYVLRLPHMCPVGAGFEVLLDPRLPGRINAFAEEVGPLAALPVRPIDVGRYPMVADGAAMGQIIGTMVGQALELDRVLGYEVDASSGSYLTPALETLNSADPVFSPRLTVRSDNVPGAYTTAKWDDEGVARQAFPLIDRGRVVDFLTTRESAPVLSSWYAKQGQPVQSRGCAVAATLYGDNLPIAAGGHLAVTPSTSRATLDDMVRDMRRGIMLRNCFMSAAPGLTTGEIRGGASWASCLMEIKDGRLVARSRYNSVGFRTKHLLQNALSAVGDEGTVDDAYVITSKGMPWRTVEQIVTAPAAVFSEANVMQDPAQ